MTTWEDPAVAGGPVEVLVRRLDPDLPLPAYAHPGEAGADLVTAVDVILRPGERALVPTDIALPWICPWWRLSGPIWPRRPTSSSKP